MANEKPTTWDVVNYLDTPEDRAAYINAALDDGDPRMLQIVLGDVARAEGMTDVAKRSGIARESLYRALSPEGHPQYETIARVLRAFGLRVSVVPLAEAQ